MMKIRIDDEIRSKLDNLKLGVISCDVSYVKLHDLLSEEMNQVAKSISSEIKIEEIVKLDNILYTREAYKTLGKKPSRYRPSAEALYRRIIREIGFYKINNIVDVTNLISLKTRFSIGIYDLIKIDDEIIARIGYEGEKYLGIRKEEINIHNLPVLVDSKGCFGNPCSDSLRACIDENTTKILMVIWSFNENDGLINSIGLASDLLKKYCNAKNIVENIIC